MALVNCPNCNHSVSNKAKRCPKCGYSMTDSKSVEVQSTNETENEKEFLLYRQKLDAEYKKKMEMYKEQAEGELESKLSNYKKQIADEYFKKKCEFEKQVNERSEQALEAKIVKIKLELEENYRKHNSALNSKEIEISKQLDDSRKQLEKEYKEHCIKYEAKRKIELNNEKKQFEKEVFDKYEKKLDAEKAELLKLVDNLTKKDEQNEIAQGSKLLNKGAKKMVAILAVVCVALLLANIGQLVLNSSRKLQHDSVNGKADQVEVSSSFDDIPEATKEVNAVKGTEQTVEKAGNNTDETTGVSKMQQEIEAPADAVLSYRYITETLFEDYIESGFYKCGSDIAPGKYAILPTFNSVFYTISNDTAKKDIIDSGNTAGKMLDLNEGTYIDIPTFSILVSDTQLDKENLQQYGIFKVGKDIKPGEYKVKTLSNKYTVNNATYSNISGFFEVYDDLLGKSPNGCVNIYGNQEYVELKDGQYIVLGNVALFPV